MYRSQVLICGGTGCTSSQSMKIIEAMEKEIKAMEALIGIEYEKITINRYWNCYRCLKACVQSFYEKEDIVFPELSRDFIIFDVV